MSFPLRLKMEYLLPVETREVAKLIKSNEPLTKDELNELIRHENSRKACKIIANV